MKNTLIILATFFLIALSGLLAFNSSSQPSANSEGIKNMECNCACR